MTKKEGKLSLSEVQALMPTIETYVEQPLIPVGGGIVLVKDLHHRFVASNMVFRGRFRLRAK